MIISTLYDSPFIWRFAAHRELVPRKVKKIFLESWNINPTITFHFMEDKIIKFFSCQVIRYTPDKTNNYLPGTTIKFHDDLSFIKEQDIFSPFPNSTYLHDISITTDKFRDSIKHSTIELILHNSCKGKFRKFTFVEPERVELMCQ